MDGWQARLRGSPELFPLDLDGEDRVELRALPSVEYEKASFLDGRLAAPVARTAPFAEVAAAAEGLPLACDFIFHIGHVGSTLLSRVLGQHPGVFSLREPQALRTLARAELTGGPWADAAWDQRLAALLALYSRTWRPGQRALIKATSFVSEIAGRLRSASPGSRAVAMGVAPEVYLATILGGPNSRRELWEAAPMRLARLNRRLGGAAYRLETLTEGEACAMSYACEMRALRAAGDMHWIDFDAFLADPRSGLAQALAALGRPADAETLDRLAGSAYLQRYSKAPEYAFGPETRAQVLNAARAEHGAEIRRGLDWLDAFEAAHVA